MVNELRLILDIWTCGKFVLSNIQYRVSFRYLTSQYGCYDVVHVSHAEQDNPTFIWWHHILILANIFYGDKQHFVFSVLCSIYRNTQAHQTETFINEFVLLVSIPIVEDSVVRLCAPHKKKLVEWLAVFASTQQNQTLYWSYYSWMDKEQTKRQYQYIAKQNVVHRRFTSGDSEPSTVRQMQKQIPLDGKKNALYLLLQHIFSSFFSIVFIFQCCLSLENRWHALNIAQNDICETGYWCWTVWTCVNIRMDLSTVFTTIYFYPPAQFPTEWHKKREEKKMNRKTNQVFVEQMEKPPTQKLSEQILLDDCLRLKPIEIVFVFVGRYRIGFILIHFLRFFSHFAMIVSGCFSADWTEYWCFCISRNV